MEVLTNLFTEMPYENNSQTTKSEHLVILSSLHALMCFLLFLLGRR